LGRYLTIGLTVVGIVVIAFLLAAAIFPAFRIAARDISIIIMAVMATVSTIILTIILIAILYAVRQINALSKDTIVPKLNEVLDTTRSIATTAQETAATAKTTTSFVAERVASPLIKLSGAVAGVAAAARVLARRSAATGDNGSHPS
jgi:uncharacterized membrane protein